MSFRKAISMVALCALVGSSAMAKPAALQDPAKEQEKEPEAAEQQKQLEQKGVALLIELAGEAQLLKLPENRLRVLANVADLLWTHDEKRARGLFADVTLGFNEFSGPAYSDPGRANAVLSGRQLRSEVLGLMARHDPSMARDFLLATRQIFALMSGSAERMEEYEERTEQDLLTRIAARDPKTALQHGRELLAKGLSSQVLSIISQLQSTDGEAAGKLYREAVARLRSVDLNSDQAALNSAMSLFRMGSRPPGGVMVVSGQVVSALPGTALGDDQAMRDLADMIGLAGLKALSRTNPIDPRAGSMARSTLSRLQPLLPEIEKYAPSRAAALRARMNELTKSLDPVSRVDQEFRNLMSQGTVEDLLQAAANAPPQRRDRFFVGASQKASSQGDFDRARKIVNENIADPRTRSRMLEDIDRQAVIRSSDKVKPAEAIQMLSHLPGEDRATTLAQLATAAFHKGDKNQALQLLDEARVLVNRTPENQSLFNAQLQVARAYALIEPARGFDIVEPMIGQLNALIAASAVIDGFQDQSRQFRDGEFVIYAGGGQIGRLYHQTIRELSTLARADCDRAKALADRVLHNESRVMARLSIARALLSPPPNAPVQTFRRM